MGILRLYLILLGDYLLLSGNCNTIANDSITFEYKCWVVWLLIWWINKGALNIFCRACFQNSPYLFYLISVYFLCFVWDTPHYFSILTSLIRVLYPCYLHAIVYLLYSLIFGGMVVPIR